MLGKKLAGGKRRPERIAIPFGSGQDYFASRPTAFEFAPEPAPVGVGLKPTKLPLPVPRKLAFVSRGEGRDQPKKRVHLFLLFFERQFRIVAGRRFLFALDGHISVSYTHLTL
ncbi:MAG: hypothetical protein QUU85_04490, partial [Candidatus Eisenbacteria bacterium]|nr:hypothetical protein [Candidatus Eisenbacteria bacterium]